MSELLDEIQLIETLRRGPLPRAPEEIRRKIGLAFALRGDLVGCVHDSWAEAEPSGVRLGGHGARTLSFEDGRVRVDIVSTPAPGGEPGVLSGRLTRREGDHPVDGLVVHVVPEGEEALRAVTEDGGYFVVGGLPSGLAFRVTLQDPTDGRLFRLADIR